MIFHFSAFYYPLPLCVVFLPANRDDRESKVCVVCIMFCIYSAHAEREREIERERVSESEKDATLRVLEFGTRGILGNVY